MGGSVPSDKLSDMSHHASAIDIALVSNAIAAIAVAVDIGTVEEYGDLLADDVVWELSDAFGAVSPQVRTGRDEVLAGVRERRHQGVQGPGAGKLHVITNITVVIDEDAADATSYWQVYEGIGDHPKLRSCGIYRDRLVRGPDDTWLLAHRRCSTS